MLIQKMLNAATHNLLHSEPGQAGTGSPPPAATNVATEVPVSSPASSPAVDEPAEVNDQAASFQALAKSFETDDADEGDGSVEPSAPAPAPAVVPPATTSPPGPAAPPVATPPVSPPAVPPAAVAPAPGAAPQQATPPAAPAAAPATAPATTPVTPESIASAYQQYEAQILPQLEAMYKLTPEQAAQIEENPAGFIPKLAAQIHYKAQVAAYTGIMSQVPMIIHSMLDRFRAVEKAEGAFYKRWPKLDKSEFATKVDQGLAAWRGANKDATTEDMIEKAGLMLMLSLGLNPLEDQPGAQPQAPAVPAGPAMPAGTGGQGAPRPSQPGGAVNIFEQMADEMRQEDL